jgi:hypothetical protein
MILYNNKQRGRSMEIMVTCPDHHRRISQVEEKPTSTPGLAVVTVAKTGEVVEGFATPTSGLEFLFSPKNII